MAQKSPENKLCEWFGHREESTGPDRSCDFSSESFVCTRCHSTFNVNAWSVPPPAPKIRKVAFYFLAAVCIVAALHFNG